MKVPPLSRLWWVIGGFSLLFLLAPILYLHDFHRQSPEPLGQKQGVLAKRLTTLEQRIVMLRSKVSILDREKPSPDQDLQHDQKYQEAMSAKFQKALNDSQSRECAYANFIYFPLNAEWTVSFSTFFDHFISALNLAYNTNRVLIVQPFKDAFTPSRSVWPFVRDCTAQSYTCLFEPWTHCQEDAFDGAQWGMPAKIANGAERIVVYDGGLPYDWQRTHDKCRMCSDMYLTANRFWSSTACATCVHSKAWVEAEYMKYLWRPQKFIRDLADDKTKRLGLTGPVIGLQACRQNEGMTYGPDQFLAVVEKLEATAPALLWSIDYPQAEFDQLAPASSRKSYIAMKDWGNNQTLEAVETIRDLILLSHTSHLIAAKSSFLGRVALRLFWSHDWTNIERWTALDNDPWGNWPWNFGYVY